MIITNWKTILAGQIADEPGVYMIYDQDANCIYVGKSAEVGQRLLNHLGLIQSRSRQSSVGGRICRHLPESLKWIVVILEPKDYYYAYTNDLDFIQWEEGEDKKRHFKEIELIGELMPVHNSTHKTGKPRPVRMLTGYVEEDSSETYLDIREDKYPLPPVQKRKYRKYPLPILVWTDV